MDFERLVGAAVEILSFELGTEQVLKESARVRECFDGFIQVELHSEVRAKILIQNFRTDPEFDAYIRTLESGKATASPPRLEELGAMFRLAEMTVPDWQRIEARTQRPVRAVFEYIKPCQQEGYRFERIVPGQKAKP